MTFRGPTFTMLGFLVTFCTISNVMPEGKQNKNATFPLSSGVGALGLTWSWRNQVQKYQSFKRHRLILKLAQPINPHGFAKFVWRFHKNLVSLQFPALTLDPGWSLDLHSQIHIKKIYILKSSFSSVDFKSFNFILQSVLDAGSKNHVPVTRAAVFQHRNRNESPVFFLSHFFVFLHL